MKQEDDFAELYAQVAINQLIKRLARLIANIATFQGARKGIPIVGDVLNRELLKCLQEQGVPNRVAADMIGVSLSTLHRLRSQTTIAHSSASIAMVQELAKGPLSLEALKLALHFLPSELVGSTLSDLIEVGMIESDNKLYQLMPITTNPNPIGSDGFKAVIIALVKESPRSTLEIAEETGVTEAEVISELDPLFETKILQKLTDGRIDFGTVESTDESNRLIGTVEVLRTILDTIDSHLKDKREKSLRLGTVRSWEFPLSWRDKIRVRFREVIAETHKEWKASPEDEEEMSAFFIGFE